MTKISKPGIRTPGSREKCDFFFACGAVKNTQIKLYKMNVQYKNKMKVKYNRLYKNIYEGEASKINKNYIK